MLIDKTSACRHHPLPHLHVQVAAPALLADRRIPAVGQRAAAAVAQACGKTAGRRRGWRLRQRPGWAAVCIATRLHGIHRLCRQLQQRQQQGLQQPAAASWRRRRRRPPVTLYSLRQKFCVLVLALKLQWPCMMTCQMTCRAAGAGAVRQGAKQRGGRRLPPSQRTSSCCMASRYSSGAGQGPPVAAGCRAGRLYAHVLLRPGLCALLGVLQVCGNVQQCVAGEQGAATERHCSMGPATTAGWRRSVAR